MWEAKGFDFNKFNVAAFPDIPISENYWFDLLDDIEKFAKAKEQGLVICFTHGCVISDMLELAAQENTHVDTCQVVEMEYSNGKLTCVKFKI